MGHCVRAIIGAHKDIQRIENDWLAKEMKLPQGYGMIFLTDTLLDNPPIQKQSQAIFYRSTPSTRN